MLCICKIIVAYAYFLLITKTTEARLQRDIELDPQENKEDHVHITQDSHKGRMLSSDHFYTPLDFGEIQSQLKELAKNYAEFVTLFTSQEKYGLPSSCYPYETQHEGCHNTVIVIEDKKMYENVDAERARRELPDVYLSGALHGDERVGPVAMVETAKLLVQAITCQAKIYGSISKKKCKALKRKHTQKQLSWLGRLVSTRRIVITPTSNAKGYYNFEREERHVTSGGGTNFLDPNRDFPFDQSENRCMRTIAARTMNELFLDHLFQMSMTFHGGTELIGFEWGAKVMPDDEISPDDNGQRILSESMAEYAGELSPGKLYKYGDMNSIIYGVRGGMEDWAYASSWNKEYTVKCKPTTYDGYPQSKTNYDNATLRAFNILVETSNSKYPWSNQYGSDNGLLKAPYNFDNNENNGYVAKTLRIALLAIDAVQPYVDIERAGSKKFKTEFKPLVPLTDFWCKSKKKIVVNGAADNRKITIKWNVGGAFTVDETFLVYAEWSKFPPSFNCMNQLTEDEMEEVLNNDSGEFYFTPMKTGATRWTNPNSGSNPLFAARVDLTPFDADSNIAVFAVAKVDQNWKDQDLSSADIWPRGASAQSHMVRVRTDPNWQMEKTDIDKVVQGRLHWISVPLTIKMGN